MKISKGFGGAKPSPKISEVSKKTLDKWFIRAMNGDIQAQINYTNYWRCVWNKASYLEDSTFINEKDYVPMNCCLCGKHMPSIHNTHNPAPIAPKCYAKEAKEKNLPHRCCDECDKTIVIPKRNEYIKSRGNRPIAPIYDFINEDIPNWDNVSLIPNKELDKCRCDFGGD